jgi:hypothetical protein
VDSECARFCRSSGRAGCGPGSARVSRAVVRG